MRLGHWDVGRCLMCHAGCDAELFRYCVSNFRLGMGGNTFVDIVHIKRETILCFSLQGSVSLTLYRKNWVEVDTTPLEKIAIQPN